MSQHSIFEPYQLGPLSLKNKIVMAPLTRSRSNDEGVVPTYAAEYYAQRAGAGLIVAEATNISAQARGYAKTPGIWSEAQVEGWKPVTEAVHKAGGLFFLQLWHTGRISHPDLHNGELPVAPSAVKPEGQAFTNQGMKDHVTPRALDKSELPGILDDYRKAARNAREAGFDGVEIHSANSYLLDQFLRDSTNLRADEYGGSIENRLRFPLEATAAVIDGFGDAARVGTRLTPGGTQPGNTPLDSTPNETYGRYVEELAKLGIVYLHVVEGTAYVSREVPGNAVDFEALRKRFTGTYIDNNALDLKMAEKLLDEHKAELVCFGRDFIANPDLVERFRTGAPIADAPKETWYGGDQHGYTDWPVATNVPQLQNA
ncbi:alkene reductase [Acidipila sp. EB88]|uniref:alkene reductase n=1 Tax=Acidipila sp. EB88 TaxID=2305226 RepID=UPI000F5E96F9|nr:alkene reductase [Acidipila sp. EB88]RRA48130.1 alkene reductase [Acidipila sp. EB88]